MADQSEHPNQAAAEAPVTMGALQAMLNSFKLEMRAMKDRINSKIAESRSRPSSPAPPAPPTPQSNQTISSTAPVQPIPAQSVTSLSEDKRWRPEEIGQFDGTGDVIAFVDRIRSVATLKAPKIVQANLITLLKDVAFNWYQYELPEGTKLSLISATLVEPWCQALIARFGRSHSKLIGQLESSRYTRKDAANRKDTTAYIQDVIRLAKGLKWTQQDGLMTAYHHFEPSLQQTLDSPKDLNSFIEQVQLRQQGWYQIYATYGSKPPAPRPPSYQQPRPQYQQQPYRPPSRPYYGQRQITAGPPGPPPGPPPQPRAYWAEEEEDYIYNAPSDAYIAAPGYEPHPAGHTPRRLGNTHDGQRGAEAEANWASAGEDHRCTHQGYTHYH